MLETRQRVCIIDDDKVQTTLIGMMLSADYEVMCAQTGSEGIDMVYKEQPDLVLLDVMMPDIDGLDVCERLKTDTRTNSIPIVFLTGLEDKCDQEKCFEVGADDYISKPVSAAIIKARIGRIMSNGLYIEFLERLLSAKNDNIEMLRTEVSSILGRRHI